CLFCLSSSTLHDLHSFPTRRSSDLFDSEAPQGVTFEVVSNDTGFSPLIAHIKNGGRPCKQVKVASAPADTQKLVHSLTSKPKEKDRKSTRLNSSHVKISYAVFCLKK